MRSSSYVGGDVVDSYMPGGGGALIGLWIFAFLIIFFIVLIFMRKHDGGESDGLSKLTALLPLLGLGKFNKCDDERVEQARDTGRIIHEMDLNSKYLESRIDRNLIEGKDDEIRALNCKHQEEYSRWLQERATAESNHRFDRIEGRMLKQPRFAAHGSHETYGHHSECEKQ